MSLRNHLTHYWPHYSIGTIIFWLSGGIEKLWEKTEWLRGLVGWAQCTNKRKRHAKRR